MNKKLILFIFSILTHAIIIQASQSSTPQMTISVEVEYTNYDQYRYYATFNKKFWCILAKYPKENPYYMTQEVEIPIVWNKPEPTLKAAIEQVKKIAEPIMTDNTKSLWSVSNQQAICVHLDNPTAKSKFNIDYSTTSR